MKSSASCDECPRAVDGFSAGFQQSQRSTWAAVSPQQRLLVHPGLSFLKICLFSYLFLFVLLKLTKIGVSNLFSISGLVAFGDVALAFETNRSSKIIGLKYSNFRSYCKNNFTNSPWVNQYPHKIQGILANASGIYCSKVRFVAEHFT